MKQTFESSCSFSKIFDLEDQNHTFPNVFFYFFELDSKTHTSANMCCIFFMSKVNFLHVQVIFFCDFDCKKLRRGLIGASSGYVKGFRLPFSDFRFFFTFNLFFCFLVFFWSEPKNEKNACLRFERIGSSSFVLGRHPGDNLAVQCPGFLCMSDKGKGASIRTINTKHKHPRCNRGCLAQLVLQYGQERCSTLQ